MAQEGQKWVNVKSYEIMINICVACVCTRTTRFLKVSVVTGT
jgi:hypothetical protein